MTDQPDICRHCFGIGMVMRDGRGTPDPEMVNIQCPTCHGTGRISNETPTEPLQVNRDVTKLKNPPKQVSESIADTTEAVADGSIPDSPPPLQESERIRLGGLVGKIVGEYFSWTVRRWFDEGVTKLVDLILAERAAETLAAERRGARAELEIFKRVVGEAKWRSEGLGDRVAEAAIAFKDLQGFVAGRLAALDKQEKSDGK